MRYKFDFRSIKFRIWIYFLLFALVLMIAVWFLQIFFLNNYYEDMKISQTHETAMIMKAKYNKGPTDDFIQEAKDMTSGDDIYIRIDKGSDTIYPIRNIFQYSNEIADARAKLFNVNKEKGALEYGETSATPQSSKRYYIYASFVSKEKNVIMYAITPLYPVSSTVNILRNQLVFIIIIALLMAFVLSIYLSAKVSRPITKITNSARKLANGKYGTKFPVSKQYTEIHNLGEALNTTSEALEKSTLFQKDLMANVSHDLRTPLTMIKSYAEMIHDLSGDNPEKRNAHLQVIIEETNRLSVLVSDMMALSAIQSGTMSIEISRFNLKSAIEAVLMPYNLIQEQDDFKIIFNCKQDVYVEGDRERIKLVISNLLTNAIKYCGSDKRVFINVKQWGKKVHCEIIDHGVGIKEKELPFIWDRYYKTSSNHVRHTEGSGLGLSIVKEILTLHKAKFGAESRPGQGTTIWFELSLAGASSANSRTTRRSIVRNKSLYNR